MSKEKLSTAQHRAQRRKAQGKYTGEFDFNFPTEVQSLEEYYNVSLSDEKIQALVYEYKKLNIKFEQEFFEKTKLDRIDITFLFFALALQCVRQYFLTSFSDRVDHKHTEKGDKVKEQSIYDKLMKCENNKNKQGGYYYRDLEKIILEGVPYDTIAGGTSLGMGGPNHRYKTVGHDPILGWVFGPMNIMTNTLTVYTGESYHIRKTTQVNGVMIPAIYSRASNKQILAACEDRLRNEPVAFAASIAKQAIHYNSDVRTKKSLPLPFVQTISPEYAKNLAEYGLDMENISTIGKQATYTIIINTIIAIIHRMFYNPALCIDEKLYKVKTKKIIMYSNIIATTSNVLCAAFTKNPKKLDVGGALVTLYRIVTDEKFISQVMHEFVDSNVSKIYEEQLAQVNAEYEELVAQLGYI